MTPPTTPETLSVAALQELSRHNMLRTLVQRRVIAAAVEHVELDDALSDQALQQFCEDHEITDEEELEAFLSVQGITAENLQWQVELPLRVQQHCYEHFRHKAEARFLERKNQLDRVVYSLLRVEDGFLARELYLRIAANEANFADLAAAYAEGPERGTKGIVGPVPLTQAHPALAEKLRTSAPGVLQEPFRVSDWWLVVRLESYTPASFDDEMAEQMASELFNEWVQEETSIQLAKITSADLGIPSGHGAEIEQSL